MSDLVESPKTLKIRPDADLRAGYWPEEERGGRPIMGGQEE